METIMLPSQKRALTILMSLSFGLSLAACGGGSDTSSDASPVATAPPAATVPPAAPVASTPAPINNSTVNTGTTAYGVLGTATARVVFIPSSAGVSAVVLENSAAPAVAATTGARLLATSTAVQAPVLLSFEANACAVDSNDLKGICIGYSSSKIAVLDLSKYATTFATKDITVQEINSGAGTSFNSYSGGSCINCGVAVDVGKKRFVVGGTGGFRMFNYGSTLANATYAIPVGENFGFLPQPTKSSFVIAPEYEPNNTKRKLRVINLDTQKVYTWDKNTDSIADLGATATDFVGGEIDAAAADINTGMISLTSEFTSDSLLVDFGQAKFDDTALSFTAPFLLNRPANPSSFDLGGSAGLTDVAISSSGSIQLLHGEFSSNIGITKLADKAGTANTFPTGTGTLHAFDLNNPALDRSACGPSYLFSGKGDPHGLGLYAGLDNGQRGLIVDADNTCYAIIDLVGMLAIPTVPGNVNKIDMTQPNVKALVKFFKL